MRASKNSCKNEDKRREKLQAALPQCIAVTIKNVLLLGYGMTLGFPTIVIPTLQGGIKHESLVLTPEQISWISSINLICVPLGCLLSGIVTQPIGRKKSMQFVNIPFLAAWLTFHYASRVEHLYVALCLTGFAGGLLEAPVLTYVAEITEPHLRGMLSATSSMTIIFGVFCQFLLGTFLYWRTVALVNLTFPVLAVLLLFLIPESPHWLVMKNRLAEAKKSLQWLRGWTTEEVVDKEYKDLLATLGKSDHQGIDNPAFDENHLNKTEKVIPSAISATKIEMIKKFANKSFLLPFFLVCFAFFLGHFSGMTTLQTFAVQIFQTLKSPIDKYYATLLLGIVELIGSLICVVAVHYIGKRPLTFMSTIGCSICFIIVATYAYLLNVKTLTTELNTTNQTNLLVNETVNNNLTIFNIDVNSLQWLPTTFLISSALLSHAGIRLLPWILIAEVFPTELRSISSGLASGVGYIFGFTANKVFLNMISSLTLAGTFWFYGCLSLTGTVILYFLLPETEGRSLRDIELHFSGVKKIKLNAGVYKNKQKHKNELEIGEVNHGFSEKSATFNNENFDSRL